ncbi:aspartate ammonia-lyase [Myxococcota bacterium]|nr:aspartate ammonia-lyase [Myxococcota bacterium]MBU1411352.1 aspartate ammonia-lyase [Myxococcota bacterium]MBU1511786.1 aspartate ammonia-lyase [Myxococcota bacterium]
MTTRIEHDALGELEVPSDALYGIHTVRALSHFPVTRSAYPHAFYRALATVKLACAQTSAELKYLHDPVAGALLDALREMADGAHAEWFVVDPHSGGAGTSVNMNINEIAANAAGLKLGHAPGNYAVDPLAHANLHQSTNDVFPTAVHVCALWMLEDLEESLNRLLLTLQELERRFAGVVKLGRTQLTPAVPTTLGRSFSTYSEAISRDRWRVFKARERLRTVNLGGTAIGTGLAAPRPFILQVVTKLRQATRLPLARAENLVDATANHDLLAEAFAIVKIVSVNLEKLAHDLRLMHLLGEIRLPAVQVGSSIMPGKFNPVICETVEMAAVRVQGDEATAARLFARGELELNAFLPLASYLFFHSLTLLSQTSDLLAVHALSGLEADTGRMRRELVAHPAAATLLLATFGHETAERVAMEMRSTGKDLVDACRDLDVADGDQIDDLLRPERILSLGFAPPQGEP